MLPLVKLFIFLLLSLVAVSSAATGFTNPKPGTILTVGGQITVAYQTNLKTYYIELWQEVPGGGAAHKGPVVYETSDGPSSSFDWVVQSGKLDLTYSKTFFFWLWEGDTSTRFNQSAALHSMSSGYFTITEKTPEPPATTSSQSTAKPSTVSSTSAASSPSLDPQQPRTSDQGLSTSAKTGIGVGVGVAVLVIVALIVMLLRFKSKKELEIQQLRNELQPKAFANSAPHSPPREIPAVRQSTPVEIG